MLKLGSRDALHIRHEQFEWNAGVRLLYASDLHLNRWTTHIVDQLDAVCRETKPDMVLLGGDMTDLADGLLLLAEFISTRSCPVYAIPGNHDEMVGIDQTRRCVERSGGKWLDTPVPITVRVSISGMVVPATHPDSILVAHDPAIFPEAMKVGYRLVLAGHLHGGQCVLAQRNGRTYPGAFLSRWNGDRFDCGGATMLVSRGVNDTLPVRWNCPREVLLCSL